jgi:DNA-cytosine methyltransferase
MLKHLSLFSGIGGASEAIRQSGLHCKTVAFSEINPQTSGMYRALHGSDAVQLGDMTQVGIPTLKSLGDIDILTAGFPCQSFSRLGKGLGWECERLQHLLGILKGIVLYCKPKHILIENVKAITEQPHSDGWNEFLEWFQGYGYSYSKHLGNPREMGYLQSRSRVFVAFSRGDVKHWDIEGLDLELSHKQKFTKDPMASVNKNCYKINPKRAKKIFGETEDHFACVTALAGDSHCTRATWIRDQGVVRGWTLDELYQLFGWERHPNIEISPRGISRATMYRGFGNSWHVGHASALFRTLPGRFVGDPL